MESAEKRKMMDKVAWAINNCETLSYEELKKTYDEIIEFKKSLPLNEQGKFGWESCLETLYMIVTAMECDKHPE